MNALGTLGGNVFYLGGHNYSTAGDTIEYVNGQRMVLNSIFVPVSRPPVCSVTFAAITGFVFYDNNKNGVYDAGDTERVPEMKDIACDVAFLPLGQTYTMGSPAEAAQAALDVKARIAVPFHFGLYEGSEADAAEFARLLKGKVEVVRLERRK